MINMKMLPARKAGEKDDGSPIFSMFDENDEPLTEDNCAGFILKQNIAVYFPKDQIKGEEAINEVRDPANDN